MTQFADQSIPAQCANPYCNKGKDGKRAPAAIRDTRQGAGYCSRSCGSIIRYKKRYEGTMSGRANIEHMRGKMSRA